MIYSLLALPNQQVDITQIKSSLKQLGNRLYNDAEEWEDIQEQLENLLENNAALNQAYQAAKTTLEALEGNIPPDLLPTPNELKEANFSNEIATRGYLPDKPDTDSDEIINLTVVVFTHDDLAEMSKTLLQRIREFLTLKQANGFVTTKQFNSR